MDHVLVCDLGSTSLRAGLVDQSGAIRHQVTVGGPVIDERSGGLETDVESWWGQLCAAIDKLAAESGPAFDTVAAIAISGVTRTQILLGRDRQPLRPAIVWGDTRAGPLVDGLRQNLPGDHPELAAVNAFHPIARLCWLKCHEPEVLAATATVLEPKDHFNFRLTGELATDRISSARLIAAAEASGGTSLLEAAGIDPAIIPPRRAPTDVVGRTVAGLPGALGRIPGRPVVCMAHDTWASVLGLGALRAGYAYNLSGTTEVLGVLSDRNASADGLMSVTWGDGLHQIGGPSQNGADTLVWALGLLSGHPVAAKDVGCDLDRIIAGERDGQPLLFLPYLQGERTPYWDPNLRGAFVGLNRDHGPADCAFAVLEGVAFLNRIVLERAEAAVGHTVGEIRFGGGGAANATWAAIKANVCGRPFVVTACSEPGLLGGAIAAWNGVGAIASLDEGQEKMVSIARRHDPDPALQDRYGRLYDLFRRTETALAPISRSLVEFD